MAIYKCLVCGERKNDELMQLGYNHKTRKVCTDKCSNTYESEIKAKAKERIDKDSLVQYIADLHGIIITDIPSSFYPFLQDLRNGNMCFGNMGEKRSKSGYGYIAIKIGYIYCKGTILRSLQDKTFRNNLNMLKYTLVIVKNNMTEAIQYARSLKHNKKAQKDDTIERENLDKFGLTLNNNKKDKSNKNDISSFLN